MSQDENHWMYFKPVRVYDMLLRRSPCNPWLIRRNLNYKNQATGETRSSSAGMVVFNFKDVDKDVDNTVQKSQVTKNFSCPVCYMLCGSFKGLQLHLNSFHKLLKFEFMTSEENQTVRVSVRPNAFKQGDVNRLEKFGGVSSCSKSFQRRQIGGKNIHKRFNVTILPMDPPFLADEQENETNVPNIAQPSDSDARESEDPPAKTRKLSVGPSRARGISLLETRQFYHSHTLQPMTLEEVLSDRDSEDEVDDEETDFQIRHIIDDSEDVSPTEKNFMNLWNSFVRKQRVIAKGHVPWACEAFSKFHKKEFIESKPLHACWRMFLLKLWDYGLLTAVTINKCNLIIEDSKDDHSDNTNNNNSVNPGIDLNRNNTMDVYNNEVDRGVDLERNTTTEVNNNNVDRGIDLTRNVTVDVNNNNVDSGIDLTGNVTVDVYNNNVDRGIDLNENVPVDVNNNNVDRGIDLNENVTVDVSNNSVDRGIDLNRNVVMDVDEDVNDNEDK